jgi:asparagine synthase (glutamine-hydrolysing)
MDVIPRLPQLYDEPFSDPSQIPTFLVSQLARQHVTVSLSGDGGDELFGGYSRYFIGRSLWQMSGRIPTSGRGAIAASISVASPAVWNALLTPLMRLLPRSIRYANPGEKLHKLAEVLPARNPDDFYRQIVSHWRRPGDVVLHSTEPVTVLSDPLQQPSLADFTQRMMFLDTVSYLPDDILAKVDRAAMGVSLETRVPMLDHELVEFAWRIPMSMKMRAGQGKWLLRQVLYRHVPRNLVERPKMGFGIPVDAWLRGPLREWAENLLAEKRLLREGYFNPAPIRAKWEEHLSGRKNWQYHLWDVLMFQAWLDAQSGVQSASITGRH